MDILQSVLKALVSKEAVYFALLGIGLNIQYGYTGLLNLGQVAFAMLGAYGVAITVTQWGVSFWLGIVVGLAAAVILALLLGIPTLRLRADYLAITTMAAAEILRLLFRTPKATDFTGATRGLSGFADEFYELSPYPLTEQYRPFGILFTGKELWALTVGWSLVLLLVGLVWLLARSPWGRVLKAIRDDEAVTRSLGKNVYWYKMQALMLGGMIGALGGVFQATATTSVEPDTFTMVTTVFAFAALVLGGMAKVWGPVVGAMVLWAVFSLTDTALVRLSSGEDPLISPTVLDSQAIAATRFVLVGIALMVLMTYRPQGMLGDRKVGATFVR